MAGRHNPGRRLIVSLLTILLFIGGCQILRPLTDSSDGFQPLWDGKSFNGWQQIGGGTWHIENGVLTGKHHRSDEQHGLLMTDDVYADFTIQLDFKALQGNSGLYFRVEPVSHPVMVKGLQAEILAESEADVGYGIGGLYETLGRGWVDKTLPEEVAHLHQPGEWNQMTVRAAEDCVVVYVNGHKTAEIKDEVGRRRGHIGLQLHGGQDMEVLFKDILIRVADRDL